MRVEIVTDAARLRAIEPAWHDLWARTPEATPFASPAWLLPWWDVFAPGRLLSVAAWEEGRLAGLAPLYVEDGPHGRRLLPLGLGLSDYLDVLLDPAVPAAGAALFDGLAAEHRLWDHWSAEEAPPGAAVLRLPTPPGWRGDTAATGNCPVLALEPGATNLAGDLAGNLAGRVPAGRLRKWRMARNRAARRGAALDGADAESLAAMLADLFRLHGARWESRGENGVLADAAVRRFHEAAAPRLLAAGLLDFARLTVAGEVAGLYYGLRDGRRAYAYIGGFDPRFAFESPGTLLLGDAIARAMRRGAAEFHFLRGREPYKYAWGALDRPNRRRRFEIAP